MYDSVRKKKNPYKRRIIQPANRAICWYTLSLTLLFAMPPQCHCSFHWTVAFSPRAASPLEVAKASF